MKNYTITVNGNVYDVTVEEGTGSAASAAKAAAPKAALQCQERFLRLMQQQVLL